MLTVSSLSPGELRARLAHDGIRLQTGPFVTRVRSPLAQVADGIGLMYADHALRADDAFADFFVDFRRAPGLRGWVRPQVRFDHDGMAPFEPLPLRHAFPMFEWAMNWCVSSRAHHLLVIHAAAIERNGCAAILPAPPGSGKSTLCAALVSRGWRLLSDELTLVRLDSGDLVPLARPVSLKNASIPLMHAYAPDAVFTRPVADTSKGTIAHMKAPADSVLRSFDEARPAWLVFPKYVAGSAPQLAPVPRARAFLRLAGNAFNYSLLGRAGFDAVGGVIERVDSYDFTYSALDDAVAVFARLAGER
jgi:HprK-related kinase A